MKPKFMWEILLKVAFYIGSGLILVGMFMWYMRSVYEEITGKGEILVLPFVIAGTDDETSKTRGIALAQMLQAHLQEIENDLAAAQLDSRGEPSNETFGARQCKINRWRCGSGRDHPEASTPSHQPSKLGV